MSYTGSMAFSKYLTHFSLSSGFPYYNLSTPDREAFTYPPPEEAPSSCSVGLSLVNFILNSKYDISLTVTSGFMQSKRTRDLSNFQEISILMQLKPSCSTAVNFLMRKH